MNGYKLTQKLKKIRGETYLSSTDQALFHELVSICNEMKWKEVFNAKSYEICSALNISDNTLKKSRKRLNDLGLIFFSSSKNKRIGCYYSFVRSISSAIIENEKPVSSSANFAHENKKTSAIFEDENKGTPSNIADDNNCKKHGSSATSSANFAHETQITPYIDIINIKQESIHAQAHETPPPKSNKKTRKKEGDNTPLKYPFSSIEFMSTWEFLRNTPKWKGKLNYALQLSLNKLAKFPEEFAIYQMSRAIESGWTGVVFPGTERDFEEWKKINHGKSNSNPKQTNVSRSADERKESVRNLADLAEGVLQELAAQRNK